jgi:hypothetical protein
VPLWQGEGVEAIRALSIAGTLPAVTAEGVVRELRAVGYLVDLAEEAGAKARP